MLIIILLLLFKRETDTKDIILKQDEIKEKILGISKELSENLLNTRHLLNQEIINILKNTEMLILDQVNKTISTLGTTDTNLQQRMENLRTQLHQTLTDTVKNLTNSINSATTHLTSNLDTKLEQLNKRFADTTGLITDLNLKVGQLSKSAEELRKLNEELKTALTSPKLGGNIGEQILENMLKNILPKEVYKLQYFISPGNTVDAAIFIENKFIPIDAKFPVMSYKRMVNSKEEEYEKNKQEFIKVVKDHIDKISKYIQPERGSFNFAFMYIPSEPIFYSLLISEDKDGTSIFNYSWSEKRVLPVSPQSLFAYLNIILLGLKGKIIEKNAEYILKAFEGMGKIFDNLRDSFEKSFKQLKYTSSNFEDAKNLLDKFESEFRNLQKIKIEKLEEK
ncbi:MAG: DNA recombination protein RmuC [Candidatus Omnitrophica bacterium]|nr:DNA recombination protein RmuC [Candidatus Omnitrophota bacterium]MCM8801718.1 DNA recombination protein RmuC [Candidatus Omnitrophota bacterium]